MSDLHYLFQIGAKSVCPYASLQIDTTELKESIGFNNFSKYKMGNIFIDFTFDPLSNTTLSSDRALLHFNYVDVLQFNELPVVNKF